MSEPRGPWLDRIHFDSYDNRVWVGVVPIGTVEPAVEAPERFVWRRGGGACVPTYATQQEAAEALVRHLGFDIRDDADYGRVAVAEY